MVKIRNFLTINVCDLKKFAVGEFGQRILQGFGNL